MYKNPDKYFYPGVCEFFEARPLRFAQKELFVRRRTIEPMIPERTFIV